MKKSLLKRIFVFFIGISVVASFTACGTSKSSAAGGASEKKELKLGISPGPYNDLFNAGVKPILEKEGYKVTLVNFSNLLQSEVALTEGSIDFNVAQHNAYAKSFNKEKNANIVSIIKIPTVRAGIFSNKYKSLKDVKDGAKVLIPQDPSNAARAYSLLQKAGWIKLTPGVDPTLASKKDIAENSHNLNIVTIDSAQIPATMNETDFAVIPGSIVYMAKMDANKSLISETLVPDLYITVVVNGPNKNAKWAKDIVNAYKSSEFKKYLKTHNENGYWVLPDDLK